MQWLQDWRSYYMYTCIGSWENGNCYPPYQDAVLYVPLRRASEIPMGRGSKRRQFPRGWGQILKVFFSRDFETRIIVFIDDFTLAVIAECFFHSLPVWYYKSSCIRMSSAHELCRSSSSMLYISQYSNCGMVSLCYGNVLLAFF